MGFLKRALNVNSCNLNENGDALCSICRRKFSINDLYNCDYCGKWVCKNHAKRKNGVTICEKCAK